MIYGIVRYCGSVTSIKKWPNRTSAKTIAKWAEHRSGTVFVDKSTKRTVHYSPKGWKGPDIDILTLCTAADRISRYCTSPDIETKK